VAVGEGRCVVLYECAAGGGVALDGPGGGIGVVSEVTTNIGIGNSLRAIPHAPCAPPTPNGSGVAIARRHEKTATAELRTPLTQQTPANREG
jgi:hypothetical protein